MFTVAAVLPFLPLIEDAMIRQLGDDDFGKQKQAVVFLHKAIRSSYGLESLAVLERIQRAADNEVKLWDARRNNGLRPETPMLDKLREIYRNNEQVAKFKDPYGQFFFLAMYSTAKGSDKERWEEIKQTLGDIIYAGDYWGVRLSNGGYRIIFSRKNLTGENLYRLYAKGHGRFGWIDKKELLFLMSDKKSFRWTRIEKPGK
jgi:hypothetical protein